MWARSLHASSDGRGLAFARQDAHHSSHLWLDYFSLLGFVNIDLIQLRTNSVETTYRSTQGRGVPPQCPFRCRVLGTLGHWLQECPSSHDFRITRHDSVVQYIKSKLETSYTVFCERVFITTLGPRKLDLVVITPLGTFILDVQICSDPNFCRMDRPFLKKIAYYNTDELKDALVRSLNIHLDYIQISAIIIS